MANPEVFRVAAEVIRLGGLCKHSYFDQRKCCTIGALNTAMSKLAGYNPEAGQWFNRISIADTETSQEWDLLQKLVNEMEPFMSVSAWNDRSKTTTDDVIALFEEAARRAA